MQLLRAHIVPALPLKRQCKHVAPRPGQRALRRPTITASSQHPTTQQPTSQVAVAVSVAPVRRFGNATVLPDVPPELWAIGLVYFVQGILELATLGQTYFLKDELHADPAQVAIFMSIAAIPWSIKPLIGFVSDTMPLFGYRRRTYLMLASAAGTASFAAMAHGSSTASAFLLAMLAASAASAVSDVVVDSMVVERARNEPTSSAGSLQSLCWASYAVAQVITASFSGSLVQDYGPRRVFELTAVFPLLVGAASLMVHEDRVQPGHHAATTTTLAATVASVSAASSPVQADASSTHTTAAAAALPAAGGTGLSALQATVSAHSSIMWSAVQRPDVLAPLAFLLLLSATPSADPAMFFYQTNVLGFTPSFLGQVQLAAACASFTGVVLYSQFLKDVPVRSLMLWGTVLAALLQSSQLVLVTGLHRQLGLDDHLFVLGGSVFMDIVTNVLSMPTMVLAARLCPPGIEATMFATLMSLMNLADGVRMGGGAALMSWLHITADDLSNMPTLLAICNAAVLLPLPLLGLIPKKFDRDVPVSSTESATSSSSSADSLSSASSLMSYEALTSLDASVDGLAGLPESAQRVIEARRARHAARRRVVRGKVRAREDQQHTRKLAAPPPACPTCLPIVSFMGSEAHGVRHAVLQPSPTASPRESSNGGHQTDASQGLVPPHLQQGCGCPSVTEQQKGEGFLEGAGAGAGSSALNNILPLAQNGLGSSTTVPVAPGGSAAPVPAAAPGTRPGTRSTRSKARQAMVARVQGERDAGQGNKARGV
mmetsp:Transcript_12368/g.30348  ORF Transcript_12368/g.30348 Transcript_12368/m.30348 type:complete len:772 (-) Transcript_12368:1065-3380(-)